MSAIEVNFDGLVGPTHNYGGLSVGNVASMSSGGGTSNPRGAAIQGISKMRALLEMGLVQGFLPPHERPYTPQLRRMGFAGTDAQMIEAANKSAPALLRNLSSASSMWTANAATVSSSADTLDGKLHVTPANLSAMTHRSIEHPFTGRMLQTLLPNSKHSYHHPAVHAGGNFGDEGAANFGRLCAEHGGPGISLFVYGRSAFEDVSDWRFAPRQALEASEAIARLHSVSEHSVFIRQSKRAIEAGAFHNDVVAVANGPVLFYHEDAYEDPKTSFAQIRAHAERLGFEPIFVEVARKDVPLEDAIKSYLFNSQLLTLPDGTMRLILPQEAQNTPTTKAWVAAAIAGNGPIASAQYFDLKQSMKNGGGPACLRLRMTMTEAERTAAHQGFFVDHAKLDTLENWINTHYRDQLHADDLGDPALLEESRSALDALTQIMGVSALYDFQRA